MEAAALEVQGLSAGSGALLAGAQTAEVLCRLMERVREKARKEGREWYLGLVHTLGTTSALRVISILPAGEPPMVMSKKTTGLAIILSLID